MAPRGGQRTVWESLSSLSPYESEGLNSGRVIMGEISEQTRNPEPTLTSVTVQSHGLWPSKHRDRERGPSRTSSLLCSSSASWALAPDLRGQSHSTSQSSSTASAQVLVPDMTEFLLIISCSLWGDSSSFVHLDLYWKNYPVFSMEPMASPFSLCIFFFFFGKLCMPAAV